MKPLDLLREADASRGAPDFVETRVRAAFRKRQADRRRARWFAGAGAMAACILIGAAVWRVAIPPSVQAPMQTTSSVPKIAPIPNSVPFLPAPASQSVVAARKPLRRPAPRPASASATTTTTAAATVHTEEFLAIPYAPPLTPTDRGEVIRLQVPRQSIRALGIPVNPERLFERVPADVLLGEDGVPRAIRLVRSNEQR